MRLELASAHELAAHPKPTVPQNAGWNRQRCGDQNGLTVHGVLNAATAWTCRTLAEEATEELNLQQPATCGLTPKLSRAAQWSIAHGKLYLPCALWNEAGSA